MNQTRRGFMGLLAAIAAVPAALAVNKKFTPVSMTLEAKSFNRCGATTLGGTAGKVLMSNGEGGISWVDPHPYDNPHQVTASQRPRGMTSMYVLDEAGFLQDGKPVYVASEFGRGT